MSFTQTVQCKIRSKSIIIVRSPAKHKEKDAPKIETQPSASVADILGWTFRQEAIASCFARDVFDLRDDSKGDFFWLGRVPCRNVRVVGLVVGIVPNDDNIRYSSESVLTYSTFTSLITSRSRRRKRHNRLYSEAR